VKIGAENKKQLYWMIGLLAVAVPLAIYEFGGMLGTSAAAPAVPPVSAPATQKSGGQIASAAPDTLDPTLRTDILDESRKTRYESGGRNIFRMEEPKIEQPIQQVRQMAPTPTPIPTPTPPPPIPLKFYGFATNRPNEPKRVFLAEGGSIFVAKQGDIVDRRYRVVQIQNTSVTIEDVLFNNKQPIPLTAR
jgi:hypothetical protein